MNELLRLDDVSKSFGVKKDRFDAVSHISFGLFPGESVGIVGESGSGKSTLLKLIAGLKSADSGEIYLNGKKLGKTRTKNELKQMQMVFQDAVGSFNPRIKLGRSVAESARNLSGGLNEGQLEELLYTVGLQPEILERYPSEISGGQCQRLAIARAIAVKPALLLCDEITSALDVSAQAQILRLLSRLRRQHNTALLFVSHDLSVVRSICDKIIVMHNGTIVETGTSEQVIDNPQQEYTKLLISSIMYI